MTARDLHAEQVHACESEPNIPIGNAVAGIGILFSLVIALAIWLHHMRETERMEKP